MHDRVDQQMKKLLDESRLHEWQNCLKFDAVKVIDKSKAMEMVLTGRLMDAAEADRSGLVSRVVPADELIGEAIAAAEKIAGFSQPIVMMAKESVNRAYETTLAEGVRFERRLFHAMFSTADQQEGMAAFAAKRTPQFTNK